MWQPGMHIPNRCTSPLTSAYRSTLLKVKCFLWSSAHQGTNELTEYQRRIGKGRRMRWGRGGGWDGEGEEDEVGKGRRMRWEEEEDEVGREGGWGGKGRRMRWGRGGGWGWAITPSNSRANINLPARNCRGDDPRDEHGNGVCTELRILRSATDSMECYAIIAILHVAHMLAISAVAGVCVSCVVIRISLPFCPMERKHDIQ